MFLHSHTIPTTTFPQQFPASLFLQLAHQQHSTGLTYHTTCAHQIAHHATGAHHTPHSTPPPHPTHVTCAVPAVAAAAVAEVTEEERLQMERMLTVKISIASNTGKLDLSDCGLSEVPEAVWELDGLEDLSLAGNQLRSIPSEIGTLTSLQRLQLSGNKLTSVPDAITQFTQLEGLWVHGNLLESLPEDIGHCSNLKQLSVAGNRLKALPTSLGRLHQLQDLACGGNMVQSLPDTLDGLTSLVKLALHGNSLTDLPSSIGGMTALKELWLQGNQLNKLPEQISGLEALLELSVADNQLQQLPQHFPPQLRSLWLYGNLLENVPQQLLQLPSLKHVWLEGNPLQNVSDIQAAVGWRKAKELPKATIGVDTTQTASSHGTSTSSQSAFIADHGTAAHGQLEGLTVGIVLRAPEGPQRALGAPGYFKLQKGPGNGTQDSRALVVAFGSAPGTPNWGGLLSRVWKSASEECIDDRLADFDVLYVVDPSRDWYGGGDKGWEYYYNRLQMYTTQYRRVFMLGDSMGATAAIMAAPLATAVHAFCPQVDLTQSSIRPARPTEWMDRLTHRCTDAVLTSLNAPRNTSNMPSLSPSVSPSLSPSVSPSLSPSVSPSGAENGSASGRPVVHVHVGSWQHDLDQARLLPQHAVQLHVYREDSHRVALLLDQQKKLVPIMQQAILHEMGLAEPYTSSVSKPVRLANLL